MLLSHMLNIGFDFDGVILDTERPYRFAFQSYCFFELGILPSRRVHRFTNYNFDMPREQSLDIEKVLSPIATKNAIFMAGVTEILPRLRERGHKLYIVTARGKPGFEFEIPTARARIDELEQILGFKFDGEFWGQNKVTVCKDHNIPILIDDDDINCAKTSAAGIYTLYFREKYSQKLPQSEHLIEVDGYMNIYHEILRLEKDLTQNNV